MDVIPGKNGTGTNAVQCCAITLALLLADAVLAAGAPPAAPQQIKQLEELDEIVVSGEEPIKKRADLREFLNRLVGQFSYDGYVEVPGKGKIPDQYPVKGAADCIGFGVMPGVQCQLNVRWPDIRGENGEPLIGGVSNLSPAMILYGLEAHAWGIRYMVVDSKGIAARALGELYGDKLISRDACVNTPGNCQRITRITAEPDSNTIFYLSDFEVDNKRVIRYAFLLHRVANIQKNRQSGAAPK